MSELSAAAAAALGIPEAIVQRSAAARAEATGMTVDEVLAAWAGGEEVPGASAPAPAAEEAEEAVAPAPAPEEEPAAPAVAPEPVIEIPERPEPAAPAAAVPWKPPVLVGGGDNPIGVMVGAVALFLAVFLVGLVGPALPADNPGARSSDLPYTEAGLRGQQIYGSVGCGSCHTQMVRPIVADVGLGAVSLNDSNQVLGSRRFGPDLSNAGARVSGSQIEAIIAGLGDHPGMSLSAEDLDDLVTYLLESRTLDPSEEGDAPADGEGEEPPEEPAEEEPADT